MRNLFENAIQSIRLGVEDYQAGEPARALSAVRNFYAGVLLLAKEVLVRKAPNAGESEIIAANYNPVPDKTGGVKYIPKSRRTIDLNTIGQRFKDFGISIDQKALKELSEIRNDIEHLYSQEPDDAVRQALAKAFPVAVELFRLAREEPRKVIREAWDIMLEVRAVYEQELQACRATFEKVDWRTPILEGVPRKCSKCQSELVEQKNPENREQEDAEARCRSCGESLSAESLIEYSMIEHFKDDSYLAMTDGSDAPLQFCPECGLTTYVLSEEPVGCVWCSYVLGKCIICATGLTPDNVDLEDLQYCSYCGYILAKDD